MSKQLIWTFLAIWLLTMVMSGFALTAEATGDSFTRGLNRLTGFLSWQLAGTLIAAILFIGTRARQKDDRLRLLARIPGGVALLLVLGIAVMITVAIIQGNQPGEPIDLPITAPGDG